MGFILNQTPLEAFAAELDRQFDSVLGSETELYILALKEDADPAENEAYYTVCTVQQRFRYDVVGRSGFEQLLIEIVDYEQPANLHDAIMNRMVAVQIDNRIYRDASASPPRANPRVYTIAAEPTGEEVS